MVVASDPSAPLARPDQGPVSHQRPPYRGPDGEEGKAAEAIGSVDAARHGKDHQARKQQPHCHSLSLEMDREVPEGDEEATDEQGDERARIRMAAMPTGVEHSRIILSTCPPHRAKQ